MFHLPQSLEIKEDNQLICMLVALLMHIKLTVKQCAIAHVLDSIYRDRRGERQSRWPEALFRRQATLPLHNSVPPEIMITVYLYTISTVCPRSLDRFYLSNSQWTRPFGYTVSTW